MRSRRVKYSVCFAILTWYCILLGGFFLLPFRALSPRDSKRACFIYRGSFLIHCTRRNERDISGRARLVAPPFYAQPAVKYYETRHSQLCTCNRDSIRQNCAEQPLSRGCIAGILLRWPPRTIHRDESGVKASTRKFFFFFFFN